MRKAVQTELSPKSLPRFHGIQFKETGLMLGKLLDNPENFLDHVRMCVHVLAHSSPLYIDLWQYDGVHGLLDRIWISPAI